jgi:hypothetical protein
MKQLQAFDFHAGDKCRLACLLIPFVLLCSSAKSAPVLIPEQSRAHSEEFKKSVGKDRTKHWNALRPAFTNALAHVNKDKDAIGRLCEAWLGTSDKAAMEDARAAVEAPLSPQPVRGDVFAYPLSNEDGFKNVLIVDFRNPSRPQVGVLTSYDPPRRKDAHDLITGEEKRLAKEIGAVEINLGGGSMDGSAKSGFWIRLTGPQITSASLDKLMNLSTLVSLDITGMELNDRLLARISSHPYLASLKLNKTAVSDEGLMQLKDAKTLKFLTIEGTSFSEKSIHDLQKALPQLEIEMQSKTFRPLKQQE